MLKYLQKVVSAVGILYCFSISKPENAKEFTKFCKCFRDFVNALAFSKGEMLKRLQDFFCKIYKCQCFSTSLGKSAYYSHVPCERLSYSSGPVGNHWGPFDPSMNQIGQEMGLNTAVFYLRGR